MVWRIVAAAQWIFWLTATLALRIKIPIIHRVASAAGALLVLNAAAVAGLYKFLFTRGPLWKIWLPKKKAINASISLETGRESA